MDDLLGNGFIDFYPVGGLHLDIDRTTENAATLQTQQEFSFNQGDLVTPSCNFRNLDNRNNEVIV